jgi:hypothetical protein
MRHKNAKLILSKILDVVEPLNDVEIKSAVEIKNNIPNFNYIMKAKKGFTVKEAEEIGKELNINWGKFDIEQFRLGLVVELEHGLRSPETNVTGDDPILTGKIALAHLNEFPDYYTRLGKLEEEAKKYWKK